MSDISIELILRTFYLYTLGKQGYKEYPVYIKHLTTKKLRFLALLHLRKK